MKAEIRNSIRTTKYATKEQNPEKWYLVNAEGKVLGRLATQIAKHIRGKFNPMFTPNADTGDNIIVINAEKVTVTGKRDEFKEYIHYSMYPGGQKVKSYKEMMKSHPERIIELAVKRMLPKTRLGKKLFNKLKVYKGSEHPHVAQQPELINL
jgi:large subunit ribosomal protein L13